MKTKFSLLLLMIPLIGFSQSEEFRMHDYRPSTPNTFQFEKYTDLPVSEYNGLPGIGIPIYEIKEDGIALPISLSYHSSGIRVNEQASWVGLGWDLTFGSIIQTINDVDDYQGAVNIIPDFRESYPMPTSYPWRFHYELSPFVNVNTPSPTSPVVGYQNKYSYVLATDYYFMKDGIENTPYPGFFDYNGWGTQDPYDSEPDIFTANFFGHSIRFVKGEWSYPFSSTGQLIVLDKKGYKVVRNSNNTFTITVPSGEQYFFENTATTLSSSSDQNSFGTSNIPSSKIWMITKVITNNKKNISFHYSQTAEQTSFPNISQTWNKYTLNGTPTTYGGNYGAFNGVISAEAETSYSGGGMPTTSPTFGFNYINGTNTTTQYSKEKYIFIDSIVFPSGKITFQKSDRADLAGGKKLDSISIISQAQVIGTFKFNYGTFNYLSNPGNVFYYTNNSNTDLAKLRLKLLSIKHLDGSFHKFDYDETPLPWKNSFAQDYWGYYNGKTTNTSLIPNPARFNKPALGDNGNNHSAYTPFTQAGILRAINYPTGGKTVFEYELNKFNNYWVPDMASVNNVISSGNGLRIASMYFYTSPNNLSTQTYYKYSIGKAIQPLTIFRDYKVRRLVIQSGLATIGRLYNYDVNEVNTNGFFSVNMMGSQSGVGYDTVSKFEGNAAGINGKTLSVYSNNSDKTPDLNSFVGLARNISLPACKNLDKVANGSLLQQYYFDSQNKIVRKIENTYANINSQLFVGARVFSYPFLWYSYYPTGLTGSNPANESQNIEFRPIHQGMIGFYPIYDFQTLLKEVSTTDYLDASLTNKTTYTYDQYNQVSNVSKLTSYYNNTTGFRYPYSASTITPVLTAMVNSNRLSDIVSMTKYAYNGTPIYKYEKTFLQQGDKFFESKVNVYSPGAAVSGGVLASTETKYDLYNSDNGNLQQFTNLNTTNSLIWDYNGDYVVAEVKNAPYNEVAYTSFEGKDYTTSSNGISNGWNFNSSNISTLESVSGKNYLVLTNNGGSVGNSELKYNRTLTSGKKYLLSYWAKGAPNVLIYSGNTALGGITNPLKTTADGWKYYEVSITGTGQTLKLSCAASLIPQQATIKFIDEVRLYPDNAAILSYTYNGFGKITSMHDEKGAITYYEYDTAGRLINTRDENRNIIKNIGYKLQTQ